MLIDGRQKQRGTGTGAGTLRVLMTHLHHQLLLSRSQQRPSVNTDRDEDDDGGKCVSKLGRGTWRRVGVASIAVLGLLGTTVSPAAAERKDGKGVGGTARAAAFALDVDVDLIDALPLDVGPV